MLQYENRPKTKGKKMSEQENLPQEETEAPEQENQQESSEDVIPVEWEFVRETFELRQEQLRIEEYISKFLLEIEKQKSDLLSRLSVLENRVFESASAVRENMSVDRSVSYELKLPQEVGGQAYFIRKQ